MTNSELEDILQQASTICPIIAGALTTGELVVRSNGQRGPCLDLRTLNIGKNYFNYTLFNDIKEAKYADAKNQNDCMDENQFC